MSNEESSIHDFDFNLICEYFSAIERQGPGSEDVTLKALSFIDNLTDRSQIADLGCGTGGQTMVLAQHAPGKFTGIDLAPVFIDLFNRNAERMSLNSRVQGIIGSMDALPFANEELDLIWSEGAIYNIGFERGLAEWHRFLKPGGFVAVTEACWFTGSRPAEIENFWLDAYPGIDTIPDKLLQLQQSGYVPVACFILPENCWRENFYVPQAAAQHAFLLKYAGNKTAEMLVANERRESQLYEKYSRYYGYAFFIGRKI